MNKANNHLKQDTDRRIRDALLFYMELDKTPTAAQICSRAGINRSTFYRHYLDIPDLMEKTENDIQKGLVEVLKNHADKSPYSGILKPMILYMRDNMHFYRVYFKNHPDTFMEDGFRSVWEERMVPMFREAGVNDENHMLYYYRFMKAGIMTVLKMWLENGCSESPEEMSGMITNLLKR